MRRPSRLRALALLAAAVALGPANAEPSAPLSMPEKRDLLVAAYPHTLAGARGNYVVFKDGTRLPFDDGGGDKDFATLLARPDIEDMFAITYPKGRLSRPPALDADPGRIRNEAFFKTMYGDCTRGEVIANLVEVVWLPKRSGAKIKMTRINGVADRLAAVSAELDALPERFTKYLTPLGGTYNCRPIAGTQRLSTHAYGIAIDIAVAHAHYWRWARPGADGSYAYRNAIPEEIVAIFEKHGFIWGGKWYHYDTMHFSYRPEILAAGR
jgi:hypothetical protein